MVLATKGKNQEVGSPEANVPDLEIASIADESRLSRNFLKSSEELVRVELIVRKIQETRVFQQKGCGLER